MNLLVTDVTLDMTQVLCCLIFLYHLGKNDPSSYISFSMTTLIFLGDLDLRLISRNRKIRLSLIYIKGLVTRLLISIHFILFHWWAMAFWALGFNVSNIEQRLQISLCLYIIYFFYYFLPYIIVSSLMIQLGSNEQIKYLLEVMYQDSLMKNTYEVKFFQHIL